MRPVRLLLCLLLLAPAPLCAQPRVETAAHATPRERYAAEVLRAAVRGLPGQERILLATRHDALLARFDREIPDFWPEAHEAFVLRRLGDTVVVAGSDPSGVLYGAEELAARVRLGHKVPAALDFEDHPQLKLRGVALGLQKPELTYENAEYDYRYTPEEFPWFYDRAAWTRYLDGLVSQRYNTLYLWNGHPFTSLLKLPKYPEAQELSDAQLAQNMALYHWLTAEADRRGITVLQGFYNIHLSHPFARAHGLPFHLSAPTPLASDYTRYCVSEFIREYPGVGLFLTLGEAMGPHYGAEWLTKTIIPGIRDGLAERAAAVGHPVPEPPLVVRAHATDIEDVLAQARPLYPNLDTMWKWNGESLTWTNIRGPVLDRFRKLVAGSDTTVVNIHLLSNLEPFRWGDPDFVRQVEANFVRIGIGGVHVYPLRYWDWPDSADNTTPALLQTDRDWIWFQSWARYAWNPEREPAAEKTFWATDLAMRYAVPRPEGPWGPPADNLPPLAQAGEAAAEQVSAAQLTTGQHLLAAYELAGICAPTLLPRIGITEGNRQVFSLGMTMPQLIDARRFNPAETLWTGDAPDGERLDEYVRNEVNGTPHHGQTPVAVAAQVLASATEAVAEAEAAGPGIAPDARAEYARLLNDLRANQALMSFYNHKTQAAVLVMRFGYTRKLDDLRQALTLLAASVEDFARLTALADPAYRNVAGMQTSQRQIPVRGAADTNHWRDLLPVYQRELATFDARLRTVEAHGLAEPTGRPKRLPEVPFTLAPGAGETFTLKAGAALEMGGKPDDPRTTVRDLAPELDGLEGIRVPVHGETTLHFTLARPAQIVVAFLHGGSGSLNLSAATEQWNLLLPDAVTPQKGQPLSAWVRPLPSGLNDLDLGDGSYVVLGFLPEDTHVVPHLAATAPGQQPNLDWLFE